MKVIVIPIGSSGDVHPLLGLALELRERGHEIVFITNGHFEPLARKSGLAFEALGTAQEYHEAINDPDLWHPTQGTKKALEWSMARLMRPSYLLIHKHHVPGETMLLGATLSLGARVAHEKLGIPLVTTQLQPMAIYSRISPPKFPAMPAWAPPWLVNIMYRFGERFVVDPIVRPPLNEYRKKLGLPPVTNSIFVDYLNSPQLVLGLFPEWYCPPPPDWPPQVRCTGFPLYDEKGITALDPQLDAFLNEGSPPVAFTPGSAMRHGLSFFTAAAQACEAIGRRGLLLTRYPENIPAKLPAGVRHFSYAPFSQVLPRCAALVHHGGIGTMAQGFAAGIPQLVMPMAHDQPDNAARIERLGAGLSLAPQKFKAPAVAAKLRALLETLSFSERAKELAKKIAADTPIKNACDHIEELARKLGVIKEAALH
jgi:rhamnosyltransferase subunit B